MVHLQTVPSMKQSQEGAPTEIACISTRNHHHQSIGNAPQHGWSLLARRLLSWPWR